MAIIGGLNHKQLRYSNNATAIYSIKTNGDSRKIIETNSYLVAQPSTYETQSKILYKQIRRAGVWYWKGAAPTEAHKTAFVAAGIFAAPDFKLILK